MKQPEINNLQENRELPEPAIGADTQALAAAFGLVFRLLTWAVGLLLLISLFQCCVVVEQHQNGIVYRFGKPVRIMQPGQRAFVLPAPLEEYKAYTVTREQSVESRNHMFAISESERLTGVATPAGETLRPGLDGYLITGDRNIVHCLATVYYQVAEPLVFYENHRRSVEILRTLLDNAVLETVAALDSRSALIDLSRLADNVRRHLLERVEALALGIVINRVTVNSEVPRQVLQAFAEHGEAGQVADRQIKQAQSYATTTRNEAESQAATILARAEAEKTRRVQQAQARAETFGNLLVEYRSSPDMVRRELYNQTVKRVLVNAEEVFIVKEQDGREIRILLERDTDKREADKQE